jgi:hypothetical protein
METKFIWGVKKQTRRDKIQKLNIRQDLKVEILQEKLAKSKRQKGRNHPDDLGIDGRIILEWILGREDGKVWTGCI